MMYFPLLYRLSGSQTNPSSDHVNYLLFNDLFFKCRNQTVLEITYCHIFTMQYSCVCIVLYCIFKYTALYLYCEPEVGVA